jgi:hypothetical protein
MSWSISNYAAASYVAFLVGLDASGGHRALSSLGVALRATANTTYERPAEAADLRMISQADTACRAPSLFSN